jgi:hypothetical protein
MSQTRTVTRQYNITPIVVLASTMFLLISVAGAGEVSRAIQLAFLAPSVALAAIATGLQNRTGRGNGLHIAYLLTLVFLSVCFIAL